MKRYQRRHVNVLIGVVYCSPSISFPFLRLTPLSALIPGISQAEDTSTSYYHCESSAGQKVGVVELGVESN